MNGVHESRPDASQPVIVLATDSLAIGGTQRFVLRLAGWFRDQGVTPHLLTLTQNTLEFPTPQSVARTTLRPHLYKRYHTLSALRHYRDFLQQFRPNAVISFGAFMNVVSALPCRATGTRLVLSERSAPSRYRPGPATRLFRPLMYQLADAMVVQTRGLEGWARQTMRSRAVAVIPNAVEVPTPWPPLKRDKTIVSVGRLVPEKGYDLLIDSVAIAAGRGQLPDWTVEILGDGPDRQGLQRRVDALGLSGRIHLLGHQADVTSRLRRAGMFVLPSRVEGFPNALLEAMAAGCPVVAADCDFGPREMLRDQLDGLLVPTDSPEDLAQAIVHLAGLPEGERNLLGERARQRCRTDFNPSHLTQEWVSVALGQAR